MRGLALAVLLVLLPSCAVGPDYERPPIPTQEGFRISQGHGRNNGKRRRWRRRRCRS